MYQLKVHKLIEKLKFCYTIIPKFENVNDIKICISMGNEQENSFRLNYCPIRKEYLLDIQRSLIKRLKYKFYFIVNGKKKVSQNYSIIKTAIGKYNVINFKEIQDLEYLLEERYEKEKEYYYFSCSNSETNSNSKSSIYSNEYIYSKKLQNNNKEYSQNLRLRNYKSQDEIGKYKIPKVKSILKQKNLNRGKSFKKVFFGGIEILN